MTEPSIELVRWTGRRSDNDPDANLKADVALYACSIRWRRCVQSATRLGSRRRTRSLRLRPLGLGRIGVASCRRPVGHRETVGTLCEAEQTDTTEAARLTAYEVVRHMVAWLRARSTCDAPPHEPGPALGLAYSTAPKPVVSPLDSPRCGCGGIV